MNSICQCFGTLRLFHLRRRVGIPVSFIPLARTGCDDTSLFSGASSIPLYLYTYKIQMPGNYPEESIQQLMICLLLACVTQVVRCTDESACRLFIWLVIPVVSL